MSSLAWSTAVVLLLLTPGLFALLGLYWPLRVSRDVVSQTGLSQLAYLVCVSVIVHTGGLLILRLLSGNLWVLDVDFTQLFALLDLGIVSHSVQNVPEITPQAIHRLPDVSMTAAAVSDNLHTNLLRIATYFFATWLAGFGLGRLLGWLIVRGKLRSVVLHNWVYDLQPSKKNGWVTAYVLTTTQNDNRILMYKGALDQLYIAPSGAISYLTLFDSSRYYMVLKEGAPDTTSAGEFRDVGQAETGSVEQVSRPFLVIEGKNIANVLFEQYLIPTATKASVEKLAEAVKIPDPPAP